MSLVKFDVDGNLGFLTVDNPPLNLMSQGVIDGFEEAVNEISQTDIRALLIRAEDPHFMGGADVHIFEGKSAAQARAMFARALPVFAGSKNCRCRRWWRCRGCAWPPAWRWR